MQIARGFASVQFGCKAPVGLVYTIDDSQMQVGIYVVNFSGGGWVMVSAEDNVKPILAYSDEGEFNPADVAPATTEYLNGFINAIDAVRTQDIDIPQSVANEWAMVRSTGRISAEKGAKSVQPLVQTRWNQSAPYNEYVPAVYPGGTSHVPVGCVATAMSQIVRYWQFPASGTGYHSYYCSFGDWGPDYGYQYANYGTSTYDYSLMPNSLSWSNTPAEIDMVAKLGRHCGVAVEMMYAPDGSGAYSENVPAALATYMRYSTDSQLKYKDSYSQSDWISMLKNEHDNGRPVYSSGSSSSGGGHAYVCDGYDDNDLMHYNWGWGGSGDGYFAVDALYVSGYSFNQWQAGIFNLHPSSYCNPPLYLTESQVDGAVVLNWNPNGSDSYNVYRDGIAIATGLTTTTYTDSSAPEGYYKYHVTSNCSATQESYESNVVMGISQRPSYCNVYVKLLNRNHGGGWGSTSNWGGAKLLFIHGNGVCDTLEWGGTNIYIIPVESASACSFVWVPGNNDNECAFEVFYQNGELIYASDVLGMGLVYSFMADCGSTYGFDVEDFETADLTDGGWSGNTSWTIASTGYSGTHSMKSNGSSSIEYTHTATEPDEISFYVKTQSSGTVSFYVDNQLREQISNKTDWTLFQYDVTAGSHTYKWTYQGSGTAYVDYIAFPFSGLPNEAPADLTATVDITDIELQWTPVGHNHTGYNIYRNGEFVGNVSSAVNTWKETIFIDGTYSYTVTALCGNRESEPVGPQSVTVSIPCNDPENLVLKAAGSKYKLTWDVGGTPSVGEDFESYNENTPIGQQDYAGGNQKWTTKSNAVGSSQDTRVTTDIAYTGDKSMRCKDCDMVLMLNDRSVGHYMLSMKVYMFAGDDMSINLLQEFGNNFRYGGKLNFVPVTQGNVEYNAYFTVGNASKPFNYNVGEWFDIVYDIDLNNNRGRLTVNNEVIVEAWEFDWSIGDIGITQLAGIEFYAGPSSCFYVDDIKLSSVYNTDYTVYRNGEEIGHSTNFAFTDNNPVQGNNCYKVALNCNAGESEFSNEVCSDGIGVDETATMDMSIVPNPNDGRFMLSINKVDFAMVEIIDIATAQTVEKLTYEGGVQTIDLGRLSKGAYIMRAITAESVVVKKIIIK